MKRILAAVPAVLLLLAGVLLAGLGGMGLAVFGTDGSYEGSTEAVSASDDSLAIVCDVTGIDIGIPFHQLLGQATLTATATAPGGEVFIGRAPQQAVDTYLFGAPYDLATKDGTWSVRAVPGVETSLPLPAEQSLWTDSDTGSAPVVALDPDGAPQTLVIMNADASAGPSVKVAIGFSGERIPAFCIGAVVVGVLLIVVSLALSVRGRRRRKRAAQAAAGAGEGSDVVAIPETRTAELSTFFEADSASAVAKPAEDRLS